jgi:APA family basic amino acid/polyamine antiporter
MKQRRQMILMHDPVPALIGLATVLSGDPVRRLFLSKSDIAASRLSQQISM